eukprot:TRINITY_DN17833_c0_g1_i1.p1 TRINITY_DN17833_c0_g1~~TRINITY_DN17833_c0_g1_i1.p1  ORF type:complete len:483 (+),score=54.33 TRINITY_DN17833_c0_g1_i1:97-1545(+)
MVKIMISAVKNGTSRQVSKSHSSRPQARRSSRRYSFQTVMAAILILSSDIKAAHAKLEVATVRLGGVLNGEEKRWQFLTKFGFGTGKGTYRWRGKWDDFKRKAFSLREEEMPTENFTLQVEAYLDEDWPEVELLEAKCQRQEKARGLKDFQIPPTGEWGDWASSTVKQVVRPHVWYYSINDCTSSLVGGQRFIVQFEALQPDGSHFSIENGYTLPANIASLICAAIFSVSFVLGCMDIYKRDGAIHSVIWVLAALVVLQFIARLLHVAHLLEYRVDGFGIRPIEIFSEILFTVAEMVQSSLLILIALGYTLVPTKEDDLEIVFPVCAFLAVIHIVLVALGKTDDNAANKFHAHEGTPGLVMMVIRVLLYVFFLWALSCTSKKTGMRIRNFLSEFRIAGSIYFLGYPFLFAVTQPVAPYIRPVILTVGIMVGQVASSWWLQRLFLSKGEYFKVSELGSSPLPGASPSASLASSFGMSPSTKRD